MAVARRSVDVLVVGAGPAGSACASHLARAGLEVLVLEKAQFPRDKVCGDGLTPRAVGELIRLGIVPSALGWARNRGLRIHVGRRHYAMPWPDLIDQPGFGLTVKRRVFDQFLAGHAVGQGAEIDFGANVVAPLWHGSRVSGVQLRDGRRFQAPVVVAADGNASRLAVAAGRNRLSTRLLGVAVRSYINRGNANADWLESWLELWDGPAGHSHLLPGYAWSFPLPDGQANVGLGLPDADRYRGVDLRSLLRTWLANPLTARQLLGIQSDQLSISQSGANAQAQRSGDSAMAPLLIEPIRGAALPMGFNRRPAYAAGLMLVGDAVGAINPFNGEGISYAMESGRMAAESIISAHGRGLVGRRADRILDAYNQQLRREWGGYFWLGTHFQRLIEHPTLMRLAAHWALPIAPVRQLTHRLLAHLIDYPGHDGYDRLLNLLIRLAPKA
ncbi:MAG: NAD(P)/FAD-dependent oxidoreductase [Propionibacteriaceae bacterium]|jgi:geranylgeranyl reductase family protein|nr:NAD(P)/FAD-dependent oxidoreductase [Propionibacteriaceae bacterium]